MDGSIKYSLHEADDAIRYLRVKDPVFPDTPEGTYEKAMSPRKRSLRGGVAYHTFYELAMYWPASRPSVWAVAKESYAGKNNYLREQAVRDGNLITANGTGYL